MAITKKLIQKKFKILARRPGFLTFTIVILTLGIEWYEHYHHPIRWQSKEVRVIDGDTIELNNIKIRLQGIDAPELKQTCKTKLAIKPEINCGISASLALKKIISSGKLQCTNEGKDKYQRQLSYCYVNGKSINRAMVKSGYARSYRQYDLLFIFDEFYAWFNDCGLWQEEFTEPWEWRKNHLKIF